MRRGFFAVLALCGVLAACTKEDPTYCDETDPCEPGYACHLPSKTCLPADAGVDLSVGQEAGVVEAGAEGGVPDQQVAVADQDIDGPHCGDGVKNNAEECDGSDLGGETCASQGFAVGTLGCAQCKLVTSGCKKWVVVPSGTTEDLSDVWASSASDVWVVGKGGVLRYDGSSWSSGPATPNGYGPHRVWGVSVSDVWVISGITVYQLNGSTWTSIMDKPVVMHDLWASATKNVVVTAMTSTTEGKDFTSSHYHYDGQSWTEKPSVADRWYFSVWGLSSSDVWAGGGITPKVLTDYSQVKPLLMHYNGTSWSEESVGLPVQGMVSDVWGSSSTQVFAVGSQGMILQRQGKLWYPLTSPTQKNLTSIWGSSASDIWAVGEDGTILHYNGGAWSTVASPTTEYLHAVAGASASAVWAVGKNGTLLTLQ